MLIFTDLGYTKSENNSSNLRTNFVLHGVIKVYLSYFINECYSQYGSKISLCLTQYKATSHDIDQRPTHC